MKDKLIHDEETNVVYFSPWLRYKYEKKNHSEFYHRLINLLKNIGVVAKELQFTNDYWVRDYMPIQLSENDFLMYRYYPDYLVNSKDKKDVKTITDATKVMLDVGISYRYTNLIIDGGNMVPCGKYVVMTDKVYTENGYLKNDQKFKSLLEAEIGHPIIIIPWNQYKDDKYGHSDGFVKWCGDNRILMSNHGDECSEKATEIRKILEEHGFEVTEMRFKDKVSSPFVEFNWAYINFLQVGKNIIMPVFGIDEDIIAKQYIQDAFPHCNIYQIEMAEIVREGGALHCISWNIYRPEYSNYT